MLNWTEKDDNKCPFCGSTKISRARCPKSESWCENGHVWHYNWDRERNVREIHNGYVTTLRTCFCEIIGEIEVKKNATRE